MHNYWSVILSRFGSNFPVTNLTNSSSPQNENNHLPVCSNIPNLEMRYRKFTMCKEKMLNFLFKITVSKFGHNTL